MQIAPDPTIVLQFLQFLILLVLFNFLLFKPIMKALKKRQGAIESLAAKAERSRQEAEVLGKSYEDRQREMRLPITEELDAALKQAHSASVKTIEEARQDLARELLKVKDTVRIEGERALEALKADSERLASEVVEKIMKRAK